jgi:NAD(P)-dependent dehydrogenase (short-subunit alcohol dehydrogenase family)
MNPVALVTGASRGIGRAAAVALAGAGFDVVIDYAANEAAARECQALCRQAAPDSAIEICQADVGSADARGRLLDFVERRFGRIDCLVNNAGIAPRVRADLLEATEASFDEIIGVNLKGPYFLTQAVARRMVELRGTLGAAYRPSIITVSSISAYAASIARGDYCVSKAGLAMMTKLFAARLAEHDIPVFEVRPGIIKTDMTSAVEAVYDRRIADGLTPIRRWGTPEDVGAAVAVLARGALPFSTGQVVDVDGGFHLRVL